MDCKSQVTLETLLVLLGFIVFVGVLVRAQTKALAKMESVSSSDSSESIRSAFGKSRSQEANFTRWFR